MGKADLAGRTHFAESDKMTSIPAKVLNVHRLFNEYLLTVQVGRDNFARKFDRLQFGENKLRFGFVESGPSG
jgi:hypothetical protein